MTSPNETRFRYQTLLGECSYSTPIPERTTWGWREDTYPALTSERLDELGATFERVQEIFDQNSQKLDQLNAEILSFAGLVKIFLWLLPLAMLLMNALVLLAFHFWK